jgi:hypothetical protein
MGATQWAIFALVLDFVIYFVVFHFLCSLIIEKGYSKKTGKKFPAAVLLITLAGAAADITGIATYLFPDLLRGALLSGLALVAYPASGFALIFIFDYLICTKYLKIEKQRAIRISALMGIITNPLILFCLGAFLESLLGLLLCSVLGGKSCGVSCVDSRLEMLNEYCNAKGTEELCTATGDLFSDKPGEEYEMPGNECIWNGSQCVLRNDLDRDKVSYLMHCY